MFLSTKYLTDITSLSFFILYELFTKGYNYVDLQQMIGLYYSKLDARVSSNFDLL